MALALHKPRYWKGSAPAMLSLPHTEKLDAPSFTAPILFFKFSCLDLSATIHLIMVFKGPFWQGARCTLLEPRHLQMNLFQLVFQEAIKLSKVY